MRARFSAKKACAVRGACASGARRRGTQSPSGRSLCASKKKTFLARVLGLWQTSNSMRLPTKKKKFRNNVLDEASPKKKLFFRNNVCLALGTTHHDVWSVAMWDAPPKKSGTCLRAFSKTGVGIQHQKLSDHQLLRLKQSTQCGLTNATHVHPHPTGPAWSSRQVRVPSWQLCHQPPSRCWSDHVKF